MEQTKEKLPAFDLGYLPLWNIAFVAVGSAAIIWLVSYNWELYVVLASLMGLIAGIVVGFTPWLTQKLRITETDFWTYTITAIIVTIIALTLTNSLPLFDGIYWEMNFYVSHWIIPATIESLVVTSVIKHVCEKWLKSEAGWGEWASAGLKVFGVFIVMFIFCFIFWTAL